MVKRLLLTLLLLLLTPSSSFAAIAFDAVSTTSGSAASFTFSHTVATGSDLYLTVSVHVESGGGAQVSSITYNGTAMTLEINQGRAGDEDTWIYYLAGPDTGTHDVVVTLDASSSHTVIGAMSFSGVAQQAPEVSGGSTEDASDDCIVSITTLTDNAWLIGGAGNIRADGTHSVNAEQTKRYDTNGGTSVQGVGSTQPTTTAGVYQDRFSDAFAGIFCASMSLAEAVAAGTQDRSVVFPSGSGSVVFPSGSGSAVFN